MRYGLVFGLLLVAACGTPEVTPSDAGTSDVRSDAPSTCSTDVASDPKNCGRCGHDCLGGACEIGKCQPLLVQGAVSVSALGVDGNELVYATGARAYHLPKAGGAKALIALGMDAGSLLYAPAVADGQLWFAPNGVAFPSYYRVPIAGGPPTETVQNFGGAFYVGDKTAYVFLNELQDGGGAITALSSFPRATPGQLTRIATVPANDTQSVAFAEVPDALYVATRKSVYRYPTAPAGPPTVMMTYGFISGIATDATYLYVSLEYGTVRRFKLTDLPATNDGELFVTGEPKPASLVLDSTNLYFTNNQGDVLACGRGGCGGLATPIARAQWGATALCQDDVSLFWATSQGGTIMRLAK